MSKEKFETTIPLWMQSIATGSIAGAAEVGVDHPLWTWKTRIQSGQPLTWNPRVLYVGVMPNALSMIPITATQVMLNNQFKSVFTSDKQKLTPAEELSCGFGAGVGATLFSGPTEMIMTQQGKLKMSFLGASQYIINKHSYKKLFSGFVGTAMRDGIFASSFLALTPLLKQQIQPWVQEQSLPSFISKDYSSTLLAGMCAGIVATATSHPFDTVKTIQQAEALADPENALTVMKKLYSEKGISGFFKGVVPRGARVMSAVTIMGLVTEQVEGYFNSAKTLQEQEEDRTEETSRPSM